MGFDFRIKTSYPIKVYFKMEMTSGGPGPPTAANPVQSSLGTNSRTKALRNDQRSR